jgi:hypothetical protein
MTFERCKETDGWIRFHEEMCPSFRRVHLTPWEDIYVQAPLEDAKEVIYLISGEFPDTESCHQHGTRMYAMEGVREIKDALFALTYNPDATARVINWDYCNHILASAQHKHLESFRKRFWEEKLS